MSSGKCSNCNKRLGDAFTRIQVMAVIDGDAEEMDHDDVCHRCSVVVSSEDLTAEIGRLKRSLDSCVAVQEASRSNRENERRQEGINHAKTTETMREENARLRQMVDTATDRLTELDATIVRLRKLIG